MTMTYSFSAITTGQTDADSPINQPLMDAIRQDLYHLKEFCYGIGGTYTPDAEHDHDGANSKPVASVAANAVGQTQMQDAAVGQAELKHDHGSVSTTSTVGETLILPGGAFGFWVCLKTNNASAYALVGRDTEAIKTGGTSYANTIRLRIDGSPYTAYAQQYYVQSSPPYSLVDHEWGHWIYLLRKAIDGTIVSAYEAPEPPWAYNGPGWNPKDEKERIIAIPHPFSDYFLRKPEDDGLEIVLIDTRDLLLKDWEWTQAQLWTRQKDTILEDLEGKINPPIGKNGIIDLGLGEIPGFTDRVMIKPVSV
jgi:hypothetical protein